MKRTQKELQQQIARDLASKLPGQDAQYEMAPKPRPGSEQGDATPPDASMNGVLILLYPHRGEYYLPLIRRQVYPGVHSGQISLPGGGMEPCDTDVADTALREAQEEVGADPDAVTVLGQLSPLYIGASNNVVYPTVGITDRRPDFVLDPREVAELIETPISVLQDHANLRHELWHLRGHDVDVPFFRVGDNTVWGATAMILNEFLALPALTEYATSFVS